MEFGEYDYQYNTEKGNDITMVHGEIKTEDNETVEFSHESVEIKKLTDEDENLQGNDTIECNISKDTPITMDFSCNQNLSGESMDNRLDIDSGGSDDAAICGESTQSVDCYPEAADTEKLTIVDQYMQSSDPMQDDICNDIHNSINTVENEYLSSEATDNRSGMDMGGGDHLETDGEMTQPVNCDPEAIDMDKLTIVDEYMLGKESVRDDLCDDTHAAVDSSFDQDLSSEAMDNSIAMDARESDNLAIYDDITQTIECNPEAVDGEKSTGFDDFMQVNDCTEDNSCKDTPVVMDNSLDMDVKGDDVAAFGENIYKDCDRESVGTEKSVDSDEYKQTNYSIEDNVCNDTHPTDDISFNQCPPSEAVGTHLDVDSGGYDDVAECEESTQTLECNPEEGDVEKLTTLDEYMQGNDSGDDNFCEDTPITTDGGCNQRLVNETIDNSLDMGIAGYNVAAHGESTHDKENDDNYLTMSHDSSVDDSNLNDEDNTLVPSHDEEKDDNNLTISHDSSVDTANLIDEDSTTETPHDVKGMENIKIECGTFLIEKKTDAEFVFDMEGAEQGIGYFSNLNEKDKKLLTRFKDNSAKRLLLLEKISEKEEPSTVEHDTVVPWTTDAALCPALLKTLSMQENVVVLPAKTETKPVKKDMRRQKTFLDEFYDRQKKITLREERSRSSAFKNLNKWKGSGISPSFKDVQDLYNKYRMNKKLPCATNLEMIKTQLLNIIRNNGIFLNICLRDPEEYKILLEMVHLIYKIELKSESSRSTTCCDVDQSCEKPTGAMVEKSGPHSNLKDSSNDDEDNDATMPSSENYSRFKCFRSSTSDIAKGSIVSLRMKMIQNAGKVNKSVSKLHNQVPETPVMLASPRSTNIKNVDNETSILITPYAPSKVCHPLHDTSIHRRYSAPPYYNSLSTNDESYYELSANDMNGENCFIEDLNRYLKSRRSASLFASKRNHSDTIHMQECVKNDRLVKCANLSDFIHRAKQFDSDVLLNNLEVQRSINHLLQSLLIRRRQIKQRLRMQQILDFMKHESRKKTNIQNTKVSKVSQKSSCDETNDASSKASMDEIVRGIERMVETTSKPVATDSSSSLRPYERILKRLDSVVHTNGKNHLQDDKFILDTLFDEQYITEDETSSFELLKYFTSKSDSIKAQTGTDGDQKVANNATALYLTSLLENSDHSYCLVTNLLSEDKKKTEKVVTTYDSEDNESLSFSRAQLLMRAQYIVGPWKGLPI